MESTIDMYKKDLEELNNFIAQSKRPNVKHQLQQCKTNIEFLLKEEEKKAPKEQPAEDGKEKKPEIEVKEKTFQSINKYALDTSNNTYVKIYITDGFEGLKAHDSKNIQSRFMKTAFMTCILDWKQKNFRFSCMNLCHEIEPSKSYTKATNSGLIIYLYKAKSSDMWDSLEKKKSILSSVDEDGSLKDKNKDPSESLMDMMKDMYNNGDDNMKRMIVSPFFLYYYF